MYDVYDVFGVTGQVRGCAIHERDLQGGIFAVYINTRGQNL